MGKRKHKIDISKLDADQIAFIQAKVSELGSSEAVNRFYKKDCAVDVFARQFAIVLFKGDK